MDRISKCESLLNCKIIDPFLKGMVSGEEKCFFYSKFNWKRLWSKSSERAKAISEAGFIAKEVSLCVWCYLARNYPLWAALYGQTLNLDLCCQQLKHLKEAEANSFCQQEGNCVSSGQRKTADVDIGLSEVPSACLEDFYISTYTSNLVLTITHHSVHFFAV